MVSAVNGELLLELGLADPSGPSELRWNWEMERHERPLLGLWSVSQTCLGPGGAGQCSQCSASAWGTPGGIRGCAGCRKLLFGAAQTSRSAFIAALSTLPTALG